MGDTWVSVEDSNSSLSSGDSDNVDSEIEAELYGMIHHEDTFSLATNNQKDEDAMNNQTSEFANPINNITNFIKLCRADADAKNSPNHTDAPFHQCNFNKNVGIPLKRKLDLDHDSLSVVCSDEMKKTNLISKQTSPKVNKLHNNLLNKSDLLNKNKMVTSDSSDSDESVIWTEPDSSMVKSDLKTNLLNDAKTISISDSSADSFVLPSPSKRKELTQKKFSLPNIKIGENSKDLWLINEEDFYRSKNKSRRYHNSDIRCNNCDQKGHRASSCSVPKVLKCFICGGPHVGFECKNKICSKCYNWGHYYKQCRIRSLGYCCHCSMKGHNTKDCPDIWRRYHLTTEPARIVRGKKEIQDRDVYCFNCGWSGHTGAVCKEPRSCKGPLCTWPSVISYDNLDKFIDCRRSSRSSFTMDIQENQMQRANEEVKTERMQQSYERKRTGKSKMQKKWEQFRQKKILLREKDFPRTPIIKTEQSQEAVPDYLTIAMKNRLDKRKRNRSRRIGRRKKNASENIFKMKVSMYSSTDLYKK